MIKHISFRSGELLEGLFKKDKQFFTLRDAMEILSQSSPEAVRKLLSDMVRRGLVLRIKDGLYNLIPYENESSEHFPNWHLTAESIVRPNEYYIGFYSALDIHGLITQPSLVEQVVTNKQIIPKYQKVRNVRFEFITITNERFFGYERTWIDDFNKVNCSDLEKTIIDSLFKPNYSGGVSEISKAIYIASKKINSEKLISYLQKFNMQTVNKRLGFILEKMNVLQPISRILQTNLNRGYAILDPSLPKDGQLYPEWKIIDNVGIESAIKSIES